MKEIGYSLLLVLRKANLSYSRISINVFEIETGNIGLMYYKFPKFSKYSGILHKW